MSVAAATTMLCAMPGLRRAAPPLLDVEAADAVLAAPLDAVPDHDVHEPLVVVAPRHLDVAGQLVPLRALHGGVQEEGLQRGGGGRGEGCGYGS